VIFHGKVYQLQYFANGTMKSSGKSNGDNLISLAQSYEGTSIIQGDPVMQVLLDISVVFNVPVAINTATRTFTAHQSVAAYYAGGTGTKNLTFVYQV
jgi:methylglyoxal synthase